MTQNQNPLGNAKSDEKGDVIVTFTQSQIGNNDKESLQALLVQASELMQENSKLIVDLSNVTSIDYYPIRTLRQVERTMPEKLVLTNPSQSVMSELKNQSFAQRFQIEAPGATPQLDLQHAIGNENAQEQGKNSPGSGK